MVRALGPHSLGYQLLPFLLGRETELEQSWGLQIKVKAAYSSLRSQGDQSSVSRASAVKSQAHCLHRLVAFADVIHTVSYVRALW